MVDTLSNVASRTRRISILLNVSLLNILFVANVNNSFSYNPTGNNVINVENPNVINESEGLHTSSHTLLDPKVFRVVTESSSKQPFIDLSVVIIMQLDNIEISNNFVNNFMSGNNIESSLVNNTLSHFVSTFDVNTNSKAVVSNKSISEVTNGVTR